MKLKYETKSYISTHSKYYATDNEPPEIITPILSNIMLIVNEIPLMNPTMLFEFITGV